MQYSATYVIAVVLSVLMCTPPLHAAEGDSAPNDATRRYIEQLISAPPTETARRSGTAKEFVDFCEKLLATARYEEWLLAREILAPSEAAMSRLEEFKVDDKPSKVFVSMQYPDSVMPRFRLNSQSGVEMYYSEPRYVCLRQFSKTTAGVRCVVLTQRGCTRLVDGVAGVIENYLEVEFYEQGGSGIDGKWDRGTCWEIVKNNVSFRSKGGVE